MTPDETHIPRPQLLLRPSGPSLLPPLQSKNPGKVTFWTEILPWLCLPLTGSGAPLFSVWLCSAPPGNATPPSSCWVPGRRAWEGGVLRPQSPLPVQASTPWLPAAAAAEVNEGGLAPRPAPPHATANCNLASSSNAEAGAQSRICDIKASQRHWGASRSPSASAPGPLPTGLD